MVAKNGKTFDAFDGNFANFFDAFSAPKFDFDALAAMQQRNLEALTEANKLAAEGWQAFAKRQAEMVRDAVDVGSKTAQKLATAKPDARLDETTKAAKSALDQGVANFQELTELAVKSQTEAFEKINAAYTETVDGLQAAALVAK